MTSEFFAFVERNKSNLKYRYDGCTRPSKNPAFIAENVLNRDFTAEHPNEKWVTDVTEFKYGTMFDNVHKLYLSAILDLCDHRPVAYVIGDSNNNTLVFETFDMAVAANPDAHPIFHSDRGYQYTSRTFHQKLETAGMTQSMSRVAHCTDNGPMEGFWGILKREMYYKQKFHTREELVRAITEYMDFLLFLPILQSGKNPFSESCLEKLVFPFCSLIIFLYFIQPCIQNYIFFQIWKRIIIFYP